MDFLLGLVIGAIIGLLANWVLQPLTALRRGADISTLNDTLSDLSVRMAALENAVGGHSPRIVTITDAGGPAQVFVEDKEPLEDINGIGPVLAQRFNAAGIYTFFELAALTPAEAAEIAAVEAWQNIKPEAWIAEARERAISGGAADVR